MLLFKNEKKIWNFFVGETKYKDEIAADWKSFKSIKGYRVVSIRVDVIKPDP